MLTSSIKNIFFLFRTYVGKDLKRFKSIFKSIFFLSFFLLFITLYIELSI